MNPEGNINSIQKKSSSFDLNKIEQIITDFPYFLPARMQYVKILKDSNDKNYEESFNKLALAIPNRTFFFDWMKGNIDIFDVLKETNEITESKDEIILRDTSISAQKPADVSSNQDLIDVVIARIEEIEKEKTKETHPKELINKRNSKIKDHEELIDKFIKEEPRIIARAGDFSESEILAKKSNIENDSFVSETLADIYIQQGNIDKGIKILEKLSLKFPEKSSYFAARIETIKINKNI